MSLHREFGLPDRLALSSLTGFQEGSPPLDILGSSLIAPLEEFLGRESKQLRAQVVELGFRAAGGSESGLVSDRLVRSIELVETLHAGSLIVDDIQDRSEYRRNRPSLYRQVGVPLALNAGNWLYFWATERISEMRFAAAVEVEVRRFVNRILIQAHFGQALDLGASMHQVSQDRVAQVCRSAMELKSGTLMALAYGLGCFAAKEQGPSDDELRFAREFGLALQMFDDIGNFLAPPPKGKEDLRNGRPSLIWWTAAEIFSTDDYLRFVRSARRLPDETFLNGLSGSHELLSAARLRARDALRAVVASCPGGTGLKADVTAVAARVETAYG